MDTSTENIQGDIKPIIEESLILDLLTKTFDRPVTELAPIESGHIAKVFSFRADDGAYILRFTNKKMGSFAKEKFVYDNFVSPKIPIPPLIKVGELDQVGLYYAISQKMPGRELSALSKDEYFETLPSNMETLLAIHQSDVSRFSGYGWLQDNGTGNGHAPSWAEALSGIMTEDPDDFYGRWHTLFDTTPLDRSYFEAAYEKMCSLLHFSPQDRYLIHRDYDYNNVLAENGKITAVLDWESVSYGDFVHEFAHLDFWRSNVDLATPFRDFYAKNGMDVSNFEQRFACSTIYLGLDGLRFFAKIGNFEPMERIKQVLEPHLNI